MWLSTRQISLLDGQLLPVLKVSVLKNIDCIPGIQLYTWYSSMWLYSKLHQRAIYRSLKSKLN